MPKLIANMVVKDEGDRFLRMVLERLNTFVDLITVTDDCSTDDTPQICLDYGAKVAQTDEPLFTQDEGALRSLSWDHLSQYAQPQDWVLAVDADELLYGLEFLPQLLDQSQWDVLGILFFHMWSETHYRVDKAWSPTIGSRLFRFFPGGEWKNSRVACGSEPLYVQELIRQGRVLWNTSLRMRHLGYVKDPDKMMKYKRYMEIDGGNFHSRAHIESITDSEPHLVLWED